MRRMNYLRPSNNNLIPFANVKRENETLEAQSKISLCQCSKISLFTMGLVFSFAHRLPNLMIRSLIADGTCSAVGKVPEINSFGISCSLRHDFNIIN